MMRAQCRKVGLEFLEVAPTRYEVTGRLPVSAERAFAALERAAEWPRWFSGLERAAWDSAPPHGVGSQRTVVMKGGLTAHETFLAWEPGRRCAFRVEWMSLPLVRTLVEDYRLSPAPDGTCSLTWVMAIEPVPLTGFLGRAARPHVERVLQAGLRGLAQHLERS